MRSLGEEVVSRIVRVIFGVWNEDVTPYPRLAPPPPFHKVSVIATATE